MDDLVAQLALLLRLHADVVSRNSAEVAKFYGLPADHIPSLHETESHSVDEAR
jgi:hypothetical protein